jgi:hypothetical protein
VSALLHKHLRQWAAKKTPAPWQGKRASAQQGNKTMNLSVGGAEPQDLGMGERLITAATQAAEMAREMAHQPYRLEDLTGLTVTTGAISPAMARHMRNTMHFERQRPISVRNVARLAEEMKRGWFLPGTPIFICVLPDGREYIVNGNHTLEAIADSGVTVPLVMVRQQVRDIEGAARAYATFDIQQTRSWGAALMATGFAAILPMPEKVAAAVGLIMVGFKPSNEDAFMLRSRTARMQLIPDYVGAAHTLFASLAEAPQSNQRLIMRAAFLAVALVTARYQPSTAAEFWGGLALDDGLKASDPRKTLMRYASNNPAAGAAGRALHAKAAALAWNAFFEGRPLEYCKPTQMADIRILGTPWHKGKPE